MNKFRRKSEVVTSVQWWKPGDHPKVYMSHPWGDRTVAQEAVMDGWSRPIDPGDWIIEHADGRIEVINSALFAATYEATDE